MRRWVVENGFEGIAVFSDRSGHSITLTEKGILLKRRALEIIDLEDQIVEEFKGSEEVIEGKITIGCGEFAAVEMLAEIEPIGLMEAIRRKMFAEISRQPDGGKGAAGVINKNDDYYNPFLDLMRGGASNDNATDAN